MKGIRKTVGMTEDCRSGRRGSPRAVRRLTALAVFALASGRSSAEILAQDDFSYDDGALVGNGSAGDGWAGGWTTHFNAEATSSIAVTSGVISGRALSGASHRNYRQLDATVAALTDGSAANDGTTVYVGIDYEFGKRYGGFELATAAGHTLRLQLGAFTNDDPGLWTTGNVVVLGASSFSGLAGVNRYVLAITYHDTDGDLVDLYAGPVGPSAPGSFTKIGSSVPNTGWNFSFNRAGFGVFVEPNGSILHADNLIIATTFDAAARIVVEPPKSTLISIF